MSQILDFLFLSSRIPTADKLLLKTCGVTHILNCAGSVCTNHFPDDFAYKTYFISDSSGEGILLSLTPNPLSINSISRYYVLVLRNH